MDQTYIQTVPDEKCDTNPHHRDMIQINPVVISLELEAAALRVGFPRRLFTNKETVKFGKKKNNFLTPFDDPTVADEIITRIGGRFTVKPDDAPYEYVLKCTLYIEDNPESTTRPKLPFLRNLAEELSITVNLGGCRFHGEFDETHIKVPFEAFGCQVKYVYWPKSKYRGANTTKRAPKAIVKLLPKGHKHNTLVNCQGTLDLEDAGRQAIWPRKLYLEIPYEDK